MVHNLLKDLIRDEVGADYSKKTASTKTNVAMKSGGMKSGGFIPNPLTTYLCSYFSSFVVFCKNYVFHYVSYVSDYVLSSLIISNTNCNLIFGKIPIVKENIFGGICMII